MTNLLATISFTIVTNWTQIGVIWPEPRPEGNKQTLEYRATGYIYSGVVLSNTVASVRWGTNIVPVILESVKLDTMTKNEWRW